MPAKTQPAPGERVRARRLALGLSQTELAERAGVGQGTLSRYERGDSDQLSRANVFLLAHLLGLPAKDLDPWFADFHPFEAP
jgi:transcriptional regulator with XRE-family HTH domain